MDIGPKRKTVEIQLECFTVWWCIHYSIGYIVWGCSICVDVWFVYVQCEDIYSKGEECESVRCGDSVGNKLQITTEHWAKEKQADI